MRLPTRVFVRHQERLFRAIRHRRVAGKLLVGQVLCGPLDRLFAADPWTIPGDNGLTTERDFTAPKRASQPTMTETTNVRLDLGRLHSTALTLTRSKGLAVKRFEGSSPFASTVLSE